MRRLWGDEDEANVALWRVFLVVSLTALLGWVLYAGVFVWVWARGLI